MYSSQPCCDCRDLVRTARRLGRVAGVTQEPDALAVVFERTGEAAVRIAVTDGDKAILRAVSILLERRPLQVGDRLTIEAADEPNR
jgi:hypothetical protein